MTGAQDIARINKSKRAIAGDRREREDIQLQVSPSHILALISIPVNP